MYKAYRNRKTDWILNVWINAVILFAITRRKVTIKKPLNSKLNNIV
jgi:hypothetical protein